MPFHKGLKEKLLRKEIKRRDDYQEETPTFTGLFNLAGKGIMNRKG